MRRFLSQLSLATILVTCISLSQTAAGAGSGYNQRIRTHMDRAARWYRPNVQWHGPHFHPGWGSPMALLVPPTANMQTNYSWGVARTRVTPLYHQFGRQYISIGGGGKDLSPSPVWPSDTTQFGIYSVRGPWD